MPLPAETFFPPPRTQLDPFQTAAVEAGDGLVRVVAGAGTGKTTVLARRVVRLLEAGEPPPSLLATTFTNKAAWEMKERLLALCGPAAAGVVVRTIDSAALAVCLRHPGPSGIARGTLIADESDQRDILAEACSDEGLLPIGAPAQMRREISVDAARRIGGWKSACLSPDRHAGGRGSDWVAVWRAYEAALAARGMVDFADLPIRALRVLDDPGRLRSEAGAVRWLLVDEFQDTGLAQARFLRALSSVHGNVFLVGDPDQSIYSFRKAVDRGFERAAELFPEAAARGEATIELPVNRRCTDDVLRPACDLVGYNPRPAPKELRSGRLGPPPSVRDFATPALEAEAVVREIADLERGGAALSSCAVLGRTARVLEPIAAALLARGLPFEQRGAARFAERGEVRDVMAYLRLAVNPSLDLAFLRIAARPVRGIGPAGAGEAVALARARNAPFHEILSVLSDPVSSGWRSSARRGAAELARHLAALSAMRERGRPPREMVEYVLGHVGYADWADDQKDAPKSLSSSLHALLVVADAHDSIDDLVREAALDPDAPRETDGGRPAVSLATVHAAKGLEWDNVFVVGLEDGVCPSARAMEDVGDPDDPWDHRAAGGIEEERRLLHVAMTRSAHRLWLSFARDRPPRAACRPSRFLHECGFSVTARRPAAPGGGQVGRGKPPPAKMRVFW